jgi:hypothetical protein
MKAKTTNTFITKHLPGLVLVGFIICLLIRLLENSSASVKTLNVDGNDQTLSRSYGENRKTVANTSGLGWLPINTDWRLT